MRVISCHINGFGKIKDFDYEFNQGLNTLLQNNGWGKTTFSVFVKAMFYGMEYSRKQGLSERKHYQPWDGGVYGGSLTFEEEGRIYRIERIFGKTDKEDSFSLINVETGLETEDYDSNLGETIFGIDRDSYERTSFIPQLDTKTGMTGSINAKMGNLSSVADDISNFDNAIKAIEEKKASYTSNGSVNKGALIRVRNSIKEYKKEVELLDGYQSAYDGHMEKYKIHQAQLGDISRQKEENRKAIEENSNKEKLVTTYNIAKDNLEEEKKTQHELDLFFSNGIPTKEEIDEAIENEKRIGVLEGSISSLDEKIKPLDISSALISKLDKKIPTDEEFAAWSAESVKLQGLRERAGQAKLAEDKRQQLEDLRFFFKESMPDEEELEKIEKASSELNVLEGKLLALHDVVIDHRARYEQAVINAKETSGIIGTVVGITIFVGLIAAATVIWFLDSHNTVSVLFTAICLLLAVFDLIALLIIKKNKKRKIKADDKKGRDDLDKVENEYNNLLLEKNNLEEEVEEFLSSYRLKRATSAQDNVYEIRRNLDQYNSLIAEEMAIQNSSSEILDQIADIHTSLCLPLSEYAQCYGMDIYDANESEFVQQLKNDVAAYLENKKNIEQRDIIRTEYETLNMQLKTFLDRFSFKGGEDAINHIALNLDKYVQVNEKINKLKKDIEEFERENSEVKEAVSTAELNEIAKELDEEFAKINDLLNDDNKIIVEVSDKIAELREKQEDIERLELEEAELKAKVSILEKTLDALNEAKELFVLKYMGPLKHSVKKYIDILDKESGTNIEYEVDINLNIKVITTSGTKEAEYMSAGYQDLLNLCARLALIDIMYDKKRPLLILDDPFTNMDKDKIEQAINLLNVISKENQIVYFTCHNSRA